MEDWEVEKTRCSFYEDCGYYCADNHNHLLCDKIDHCCIKKKIDELNREIEGLMDKSAGSSL